MYVKCVTNVQLLCSQRIDKSLTRGNAPRVHLAANTTHTPSPAKYHIISLRPIVHTRSTTDWKPTLQIGTMSFHTATCSGKHTLLHLEIFGLTFHQQSGIKQLFQRVAMGLHRKPFHRPISLFISSSSTYKAAFD